MNSTKNFGRTIQLFLVDGKPTGLRKATIHGWTGVVLVASQSTFPALTAREEIDRTGVYV
ncbi:MAG: GIY-YIG nuclease family protein, partial [Alphaproteobacteria bacterium]